MKLEYPSDLWSIFHNTCLVVALTAGVSLDFFSSAHGNVNAEHDQRLTEYPSCLRTKRAVDVLGYYHLRNGLHGNLSQYHAYLSCVWDYGGPDVVRTGKYYDVYRYYNSHCADLYQCVPVERPDKGHILFFRAGGLLDDRPDTLCGVNITELLIRRRTHHKNGELLPLDKLCENATPVGVNPIDILCPGVTQALRKWNLFHGQEIKPPPNPCDTKNFSLYQEYVFINQQRTQ